VLRCPRVRARTLGPSRRATFTCAQHSSVARGAACCIMAPRGHVCACPALCVGAKRHARHVRSTGLLAPPVLRYSLPPALPVPPLAAGQDYKFYIKLLTGYKLDEALTVWMLSILCNMTYCILVFLGPSVFYANMHTCTHARTHKHSHTPTHTHTPTCTCTLCETGFMYVPRNVMLVVGLLTCAIGPALVLVVLGCVAGCLLCMVHFFLS